ncbi:MAG: glycosyl hydrolase, partial [Clostridiaceae bacterium]|nr:glycosyl hydrolase [Clostridiaceae bacterium]
WALYGFALSYKYTKDERYLNAAKKVAHYFVSALPADYVPYWDFRINPEGEPRDTSAAAIAASGLIEISRLVSDGEKQMYLDSAQKILKSLYENYSNFGKSDESLLREGTSNKPEKTNINVGLIYGDYFFVEALYKLLGNSELFW